MNIFHVFINQATKLFYLQFKKEKLFLIIIILIFNIRKNYFEWYIYLIIFIFLFLRKNYTKIGKSKLLIQTSSFLENKTHLLNLKTLLIRKYRKLFVSNFASRNAIFGDWWSTAEECPNRWSGSTTSHYKQAKPQNHSFISDLWG